MGKPNWANQTIWTGDNLPIMRGMNSESVDLIYLDPPFNSKINYAAPIGSKAAGAAFKDTWSLSDVDVEWINLIEEKQPKLRRILLAAQSDSDKSYLIYMAARLLEIHRILKSTGSIYLHCDPTMSHYLKLMIDAIFGRLKFRNEIVWDYSSRLMDLPKFFNRKHDIILFYGKTGDNQFLMPRVPWDRAEIMKRHKKKVYLDEQGEEAIWMHQGKDQNKAKLKKISEIMANGKAVSDVWSMPILTSSAKERTGYPTQKPLALLDRIVKASSNRDDVVMDPFCGCATACIAAQAQNRKWTGIDISSKAAELVQVRMKRELGLFYQGVHRTDIPKRTDIGKLPKSNSRENRQKLYGEQAGNCVGCSTHFEARHLEVDHIISRAKGGTDHLSNLQLLCGNCNRVKGDRGMDYLKAKLQMGV